ncbi:MAG: tetratricopeptide repeat protein [Rubrivivax sp.]|nr:tetratricopeptide repeat protein [Rubrivivax sp.]
MDDPTPTTLDALRQQWHQLHERQRSGALDAAAYEAQRKTLEQRIVSAVVQQPVAAGAAATAFASAASAASAAVVPAPRASGRFIAVAAVFVVAVAAAGYAWKGEPRAAAGTPPHGFEQAGAGSGGGEGGVAGHPGGAGAEQLDALVRQLQERLDKQPGDAQGWALLGRSQMALNRFEEAAAAYRKALAIKPDDAALLTDYADALGVLNGRSLEGEPQRLLDKALKLDPRHIKALVLVGTLEFQRGNFAGAQKRWEEAVAIGPAGDGLVELAREGASQAQARQQGAGGARPGTASNAPAAAQPRPQAPSTSGGAPAGGAAAAAGGGIRGTVRLAASLKAQAAPGDTVFIFARAAGGGGMPLAILQKRVSDLPATFTLDDSQAMSPAARLSAAQQVVVTARISKSGQATPQPGDLEGVSAPVAPGSAAAGDLVVEIGTVRR